MGGQQRGRLERTNELLSSSSGYDAVVRVAMFSSALMAQMQGTPASKALLQDVNSKASTTRLILHLTLPPILFERLMRRLAARKTVPASASSDGGEEKKTPVEETITQLQTVSTALLLMRYICENVFLLSKLEPKSYLGLDGPELSRRTARFSTMYNSVECVINSLRILDFGQAKPGTEFMKLVLALLVSGLDLLSAYSGAQQVAILSDFESSLVGTVAGVLNLYLRFSAIQ